MSDGSPQRDHKDRPLLEYQTPERHSGKAKGIAVAGGALVGIIGMVFLVALFTPSIPRAAPRLQIVLLLVLAVAGIVGSFSISQRPPHTPRRWFWFGALIGGGVTALIEGLCFAAFS